MKLFGNGQSGGAHTGKPAQKSARPAAPAKPQGPAAQNKPTEKKKGRKWVYIVGAVVLVLVIGLIGYAIWERPPEITPPSAPTVKAPVSEKLPTADDPSGPDTPDAPAEPVLPGEAPLVEMSGDRKDGVYTMLLVGRDFASNSTDTIIVGSFDTVNHKISCINIPRDTLINIKWANTPKKINAVYPGYVNSGEDGLAGLRNQIKNILGFDVDCYALVTLDAVEQAVDAIGGVWFDVPINMYYGDPLQNLSICIDKGYQLLDGKNALALCRYRHTYSGGDLDRINMQQEFLKAAASQMLSLGNIPNLGNLIDILVANLETNLSAANMAWFARQFLQCDMDDISFSTLPVSTTCLIGDVSFVSVDVSAWLDVVNTQLSPYADPVTQSNVNILTSNYSGTSMSSTTGEIAGGPDSFYCLTCTVNNNGKVVWHAPGACPLPEEEAPEEAEDPEETVTPEEGEAPEEMPTEEDPAAEPQPEETPEIEVVIVPPGSESAEQ